MGTAPAYQIAARRFRNGTGNLTRNTPGGVALQLPFHSIGRREDVCRIGNVC
jgi:hypothetical protein